MLEMEIILKKTRLMRKRPGVAPVSTTTAPLAVNAATAALTFVPTHLSIQAANQKTLQTNLYTRITTAILTIFVIPSRVTDST